KDYAMKGRTYRYFSGKVQYPFGFGLSYTSFSYSWKTEPKRNYVSGDTVQMTVQVQNPGYFDGDEVVQAYIAYPQIERMPLKELKAFKRVSILKGTTAEVKLSIPVSELQKWDLTTGKWKLYKGQYSVMVGKNSEDFPLKKQFLIK
ncbi:MAG: fibronectin type III-like domain-contianing protein, partial [Bacteroidota bacterium]|nr:fibronectin type III-like domain-contianing protein [Bacteroidota bacterium]